MDRNRLLDEYAVAVRHYSWSIEELNRQRATLPREEYAKMYQTVDDAREECERLKTELSKRTDLKQLADALLSFSADHLFGFGGGGGGGFGAGGSEFGTDCQEPLQRASRAGRGKGKAKSRLEPVVWKAAAASAARRSNASNDWFTENVAFLLRSSI